MSLADRARGLRGDLGVKTPCRAATTANITLSGLQTIDAVVLAASDRVLVKNQTTTSQNGIWEAATGAWVRAPDFDGVADVVTGTLFVINEGTANAGYAFRVATTGTITPGTTGLTISSAVFGTNAASALAAQVAAEAARDLALTYSNNAATSYDLFDDRYLGPKTVDPTLDNDGAALVTGTIYYNTTSSIMRVWSGTSWGPFGAVTASAVSSSASGDIVAVDVQAAIVEIAAEKANKAVTNTFTKAQVVASVALTLSASNLNTDASAGNDFTHTTTANFVMVNPTNLVSGGWYHWHFTQGATPFAISSYGALFKFSYGVAGVLTATAAKKDTLSCFYDGTILRCAILNDYS